MFKSLNIAALQHPKTTSGGILAFIVGIALLVWEVRKQLRGEPVSEEAWAIIVALFAGGWSAVWAKDGDKSNAPTPTAAASATPKGFATWPLIAAIALLASLAALAPRFARGQEPAPAALAPLAVDLGGSLGLELRLNVSVVAGSYDLTHRAWLGQGELGGLYALTSRKALGAGLLAGGAVTFDSASRPLGVVNAGIVSPRLVLTPTLALHGAVLYGRRFGPDPADLIRVVPTLEF